MSAERIIDANANRAREAARVMEDAARFTLCDERLARRVKTLRHDLASALGQAGLDALALLSVRDASADVGTSISTSSEQTRSGMHSIVDAACLRLTEALRSLEECVKSIESDQTHPGSRAIEQLRYTAYDIERDLRLAMGSPARGQWTVCVLISERLCTHHSWEDVARGAIAGGAGCLQLREKDLSDRALLERAGALVKIARAGSASVVINDRVDIALASGADGVHLGQDDLPIEAARRIAGSKLIIGISTSTIEQALMAARAGADVLGIGPMYPTNTKHKEVIVGPAHLARCVSDPVVNAVPHLAIGGIHPDRVDELCASGCCGIAVSSCVCAARDPEAVVRALGDRLSAQRRPVAASPSPVERI